MENESDFEVKLNGQSFDIATFLRKHPGGKNLLKPFQGKEIGKLLRPKEDDAHQHSPAALYLLKQYKEQHERRNLAEGSSEGSKAVNNNVDNAMDENLEDEEDLEKFIDWNKPILRQVGCLGPLYNLWIKRPVDRNIRLFESDRLEALTRTSWKMVVAVWVPVLFYCLHCSLTINDVQSIMSLLPILSVVAMGTLTWTIFEYVMHRWLFHLEPPGDSPKLILLHFLAHGIHHKAPFDSGRLVIPPTVTAIFAFLFHQIHAAVSPYWMQHAFAAGFVLGYLLYDLTHYYIHYGNPSEGSFLYYMKRYHNHHHFSHHDSGYGVSSPVWDGVFNSKILLKKLAKPLRW